MAFLRCWRCLPYSSTAAFCAPRTAAHVFLPTSSAAAIAVTTANAERTFSTTTTANAIYQKVVAKKGVHRVGGKVNQAPKNVKKHERGPRVKPGERKTFRKRIVLSNNNALPVALIPANGKNLGNKNNIGKVLALTNQSIDKLRTANAFKSTQSWGMFRNPAVLVRKETVDLCNRMEKAISQKKWLRLVVSGDKVSGKSMLMLQAMVYAYEHNWIVLHIPEGQELVINHTDYAPVGNSELWAQPSYALSLLRQLSSNNSSTLQKLRVSKNHHGFGIAATEKMNLNQLCHASREIEDAWAVFAAVWYELTEVPGRPPIVFALDGLSHIMRVSDYKTKDFKPIHAHDMGIIRGFVDLLSGRTQPTGGGVALGVMSNSNRPKNKSVDYAVEFKEATLVDQLPPEELPYREPYSKQYDIRVDEVLKDTDLIKVGGLDKNEARAIMEYWAASGVFRHAIDERCVTDVWSLGGHGNLGEMERSSLLNARL